MFEYGWFHVPTGKRGTKSESIDKLREQHSTYSNICCLPPVRFCAELLCLWNNENWIYYPISFPK